MGLRNMTSLRLEFFLEKRSRILGELEELFNEVKREPQAIKDEVFGSKAFYYKLKENSHDWQKLEDKQTLVYKYSYGV